MKPAISMGNISVFKISLLKYLLKNWSSHQSWPVMPHAKRWSTKTNVYILCCYRMRNSCLPSCFQSGIPQEESKPAKRRTSAGRLHAEIHLLRPWSRFTVLALFTHIELKVFCVHVEIVGRRQGSVTTS